MMLSLYSAKAIALQIRFRRIRMERPRRGEARTTFDISLTIRRCDSTWPAPRPLLSESFCSEVGSVVALPDVDSHIELQIALEPCRVSRNRFLHFQPIIP